MKSLMTPWTPGRSSGAQPSSPAGQANAAVAGGGCGTETESERAVDILLDVDSIVTISACLAGSSQVSLVEP